MAELDTNALALACQQPAAEDAGMKPPPPASIPPPTPLKRKASTGPSPCFSTPYRGAYAEQGSPLAHVPARADLKDSYSGKKENPLLLSDSDGASESELSEPDDDLIVMSPEKPSASSQPQAGPSSIKPSGPTKPRKKASTVSRPSSACNLDPGGSLGQALSNEARRRSQRSARVCAERCADSPSILPYPDDDPYLARIDPGLTNGRTKGGPAQGEGKKGLSYFIAVSDAACAWLASSGV